MQQLSIHSVLCCPPLRTGKAKNLTKEEQSKPHLVSDQSATPASTIPASSHRRFHPSSLACQIERRYYIHCPICLGGGIKRREASWKIHRAVPRLWRAATKLNTCTD
ncbi:hypothetical protein IV203_016101 [Nitzschia inconspicua]|uniref:Uncharacterized protein n=1 Tax=Nitzschia inconspicua TaxID=303405 RepID=A0A9K3PHX0_9STRA|nr:hypothetical protein IV203_016101 [Nitzschia inconspicua]